MDNDWIREGLDPRDPPPGNVDEACDLFESAWQSGQQPRIEVYLKAVPERARRAAG